MSTLTDAKLRKYVELLFSETDGEGGSPDRASGAGCSAEETTTQSTEPPSTDDGAPDRASGAGCSAE